jgi:peptide/nickel transport system substrate-binding protein
LLKEAGFEDINGDGILDKDMGNYHLVFSFDLLTNAGNKDRELTAMAIQEELSGIGIDIHVRFEEWTTFISKYIDRKNFDAILLAWGLSFDPDDTYSVWSLGEIPDVKNGKFGLNAISFANQEVEDHYLAARLMLDRAERKKHYYRIHEIINQQQPYTFLYSAQGLFAVSRRIHNVQVNEISAIYNLETWWVD